MTERPTEGGSYIRHADGSLERVQEPTRPHPDGDAPRTADGLVIGPEGLPMPPAPDGAPAPPSGEEEA